MEPVFFDANAQLGSPQNGALHYAATVMELLKEMDRCGVAKALVRDVNLQNAGAVYGNAAIARHLNADSSGRLYGVWAYLPPQTGEIPEKKALYDAMKQNRIKAMALYPEQHGWVVSKLTLDGFMPEAAERNIPILISPLHFKNWESIYGLLELYPDNVYICQSSLQPWGADRFFRPLLEHYPNFYLELSQYWMPDGVTDLVKKYGAEHLLYGSGFPDLGHGSMMLSIRHSEVSDAEKQMIAGKNLEQLLEDAAL